MNCVVALIVAILMAVAVPGFAVADEAKVCRTGHEAYSPARGPPLGALAVNLWQAMDEHSLGKTLAQIGIGFQLIPFVLSDAAARRGWCIAPAPDRAARFYADGVARDDWGSMVQLAVMKAEGTGVAADPAGAVALFRRGLLRAFAGGVHDWDQALCDQFLVSLPPVLATQRTWAEEAIKRPNPDALAVAEEFLDRDRAAWDPMAACLYLDRQSWQAPDVAFALYRMMRDQPGRLPAPSEAAKHWLNEAVSQKFGPALAEAGRRFMTMDGDVAKMDAITYLAAAKKAGEDVGDLLEVAERG